MEMDDIERLRGAIAQLKEQEQNRVQNNSHTEAAVNLAIRLEILRFTQSMIETQDLGCHYLQQVEG